MKIHILFEFQEVSGGGNQFLRALKSFFIKKGCYIEKPKEADVVLFNSHQCMKNVLDLKQEFPRKFFVHRIDGPMRLYNDMNDKRDFFVNLLNKSIADATIFQSEWSKKQNYKLGLKKNEIETVIFNAPDPGVFCINDNKKEIDNRIVKLIATSWSNNWNKGFKEYKWLDENLDFDKYEMTFVGNLPTGLGFRNIKHIKPLKSKELAKVLKENDIFITASKKDPCSNSLIEALHCGLPAVGLNDGGHPEIIKSGGGIFNKIEEVPAILGRITQEYPKYQEKISLPTMEGVGTQYLSFIESAIKNKGGVSRKKSTILKRIFIYLRIFIIKIKF
jgi:glycosyltransferase involved in cell wall biosynthesis